MSVHLYALCCRVEALVASELEPEDFGTYMAAGTKKLARGNVMFFEVNPKLESDYFRLGLVKERCVPHADGTPKHSLYVSIYRVLEHLELDVIGRLYLITQDGRALAIAPQEHKADEEKTEPHLYQELCPVAPLIASSLGPTAFCKFITDSSNAIFVPRIFFADMLMDRDETGSLASYLPYKRPRHIEDCLKQVAADTDKKTKTVDRAHAMECFYGTVGRGFFLGDQTGVKFYPFPTREQLQGEYYIWWRSASMGF